MSFSDRGHISPRPIANDLVWVPILAPRDVLVRAVRTLGLSLCRRKRLEERLAIVVEDNLSVGESRIHFFRSGRSCIHAVMLAARSHLGLTTAFVPDYVCNVVHVAAAEAGMKRAPYRVCPDFRPDIDAVAERISSEPGVVVLASLYGRSFDAQDAVERLSRVSPSSFFLLDQCQAAWPCPMSLPTARSSLVVSFNSKAVNGLLGGAAVVPAGSFDLALSDVAVKGSTAEPFLFACILAWRALAMVRMVWKGRGGVTSFPSPMIEFSTVSRRYYRTEPVRAPKVVLAAALIATQDLAMLNRVREENTALLGSLQTVALGIDPLADGRGRLAPLVPVQMGGSAPSTSVPLKGPYGYAPGEALSDFVGLTVFRNDGLWRGIVADECEFST